jgi:transposase
VLEIHHGLHSKCGLTSWIGLVPKQHSSGGKDRLGSISKQDDRYLRSLFVAGFLYRSPLAIMAQAIRAILLASAMAATLVGFRVNNAVSQGRWSVPWILA